jgi:hypothetical protein
MKSFSRIINNSIIIAIFLFVTEVDASCPNLCNGNGVCDKFSRCTCASGFQGADCSEKRCPFSIAWSDMATATDVAHASAECSNRGICDRESGNCACMSGFSGSACERLSCPDDCNGQGICFSIHDLASRTRNEYSEKFTYRQPPLTMIAWDADKIQGCKCDDFLYGYDCSFKKCPQGDDPLTANQVNEIQLIKCTSVAGYFTLFYQGVPSTTIPYSANAQVVKAALLNIPEITDVKVTFSQGAHTQACQATNANIISVEFTQQFGPQHPLVPYLDSALITAGGVVEVAVAGDAFQDAHGRTITSVLGTKENDLCSGRGLCSRTDGLCSCYDTNGDAYESSDGYGNAGSRGDCGWLKSPTTVRASTCPGEMQCSGHGVCDSASGSFRCSCSTGWTGGDCSEKLCPNGRSWYGYPTADYQAHNDYSECSNMGNCDYTVGQCVCRENFYGEACEYMACGGGVTNACSGHGRCMSMAELAYWADDNGDATEIVYGSDYNDFMTWDYDRIHGCKCDEGFDGYDCSLKLCPMGDDAGTYEDHVEVQLLQCLANNGNFTLSFRQAKTELLYPNTSAIELKAALVKLKTIDNINVYFLQDIQYPNGTLNYVKPDKVTHNGNDVTLKGANDASGTFIPDLVYIAHNVNATINSSLCQTDGSQIAIISFDWTHGDLPAILLDPLHMLEDYDNGNGVPGSGRVNVYHDGGTIGGLKSVAGTTEVAVCNNRGLCDINTGACHCFEDWTSSDGSYRGGPGSTGDCGLRDVEKLASRVYP